MDRPGRVTFDPSSIRSTLRRLKSAGAQVFGSEGHRFALNAPLSDTDVAAFEHRHGVALPDDYRRFLTGVANGGAGPYYGVFPLGYSDGLLNSVHPWGDFVGTLAAQFPYREAWNDLTGCPDAASFSDDEEEEYVRHIDAFNEEYWAASRMSGAIPICHKGCALRVWLVVSGEEAGRLWDDHRADYRGVSPATLQDGTRATFGPWYMEWLATAAAQAGV